MDSSDKITRILYPGTPNKCAICNRGSDGEQEFIDFQLSVDYYGAIVICLECFAPVAQVLGYVEKSEVITREANLAVVLTELEGIKQENERLKSALDSIISVRPHLSPDYSMPNADAGEDADTGQFALEYDYSAEGDDYRISPKPPSKRGPENVSDVELSDSASINL